MSGYTMVGRGMAGPETFLARNALVGGVPCCDPGVLHAVGEPEGREDADGSIGHVEFPPSVTMPGRSREGVVIVVPTLAEGQQCHPPEIRRGVPRLVSAVAPE